MKITWIVNNINQAGGVEQVVCGLFSFFSKELGHVVRIISVNSNETHIFFPLAESVSIQHLGIDWRTQTLSKRYSIASIADRWISLFQKLLA